ncbi:mechanosensitive ion channel domain-containing protein [Parendozoicomonas haliclonae]|uniref:Mechanosensitive channel MscK n=1 Tax=Parendozoicomonas haliclonae TaxID=1960125 RepID=A0A1X7AJ64_9GAMM|nr:mechanosensitive ion channel domain-containing protein [Parendozoicomonas haliclonae]SMA45336.1 Mechanosensitive channel MscK precursor [Parendozoicomonas haliclonae]
MRNLAFLVFLTLFWSTQLTANTPPKLPTQEAISKAIEQMQAPEKPQTEKDSELKDIYNKTLTFLRLAATEQEQVKVLKRQIDSAPNDLTKLQTEFDTLQIPSDTTLLEKYRHLPVEELRKVLDSRLEDITELQNQLARIANQITQIRARPEKDQATLSKNQERLKEVNSEISLLDVESSATDLKLKEQKKIQLQAEANALQQQDARLTLEIRSSSTLLDLETARQRLLSQKLKLLEQEVLSLQTIIDFKRRAASEQAVATASRLNRTTSSKALLQNQAALNMELSQQLLSISDKLSLLSSKSTDVRTQLNSLSNISQSVRQQSLLLGENQVLAKMLRKNLRTLPNLQIDSKIPELIAQIRLQKFQFDQKRQTLSSPDTRVEELIALSDEPASYNTQDKKELLRLMTNRQKLLEDLSEVSGTLLSTATSLDIDQQSLVSQSRELSATLEERLFWMASNQSLGIDWILALPETLWNQLMTIPWDGILLALVETINENWLISTFIIALSLLLRTRRRMFMALQRTLTRKMGNVRHDTLTLTPLAIVLSILQVMPLPVLMGFSGVALRSATGVSIGVTNLGSALIITSFAWLLLSLAIKIHRPHDIAVTHFRWPPKQCRQVQALLIRLRYVMVPLLLAVSLANDQPTDLNQDILGMTLLMLGSLLQGWILFSLMRASSNLFGSKFLHVLLTLSLVLIAFAQLILTASGYYYTALQLQFQLAGTLYMVGAAVMLQALVIRSLNVAERRLAFTRALKKRAASKEGESVEEPNLDLATVNQQSLRLLNALMIVGLFIGLFWFWKELFSLLNVLDNVTLWELAPDQEDGKPFAVKLSHLLLSLIALATSFILARNLPGLLEVTLLSRMKLRAGSSYAITTLLSYTISCVGFITALSLLGASWAKLQWLIAALGIGIGIGLQEIVANFVAGLIILFERPVRIGDTITLGELHGEVTRIRIRSTTVTDWDHKEVIIPNKILIGEKLINWSLTNTIVRIILPFQVAHGTDPKLVHKILHQAAAENPRIVSQPDTLVLLMEYGNSALNYELRTFVTHVDDRLPVRDQINARVQELFREHGVTIAHPKQDLFLYQQDLRSPGANNA